MKENNEIKDFSQVINNPIENNNNHNNNKQNKSNIELITNEVNDIFAEQVLIKKKSLTQKKDFFELEITILKDMIQTKKDISLLIIIQYTYPQSEPEIYCLTEFCSPNICDGRNLLFDIIKKKWQKKVHNLDYVINKLPGFFISFIESRKKNKNFIVGKFELNKLYSLDRLKELPIYFHLITHKEKKSTFKSVKTHKIITISEISFCMYEIDNNNKGYCKLIFFADLKDLIGTKLESKKTEIEIKWKNLSNDKKSIKIEIISSNYENINKILLDNQKAFLNNSNEINENKEKIGSSNNNNNNKESKEQSIEAHKGTDIKDSDNKSHENKIEDNINESKKELDKKKTGSVPNINIAMVEKQIIYIEKSINVGDDKPNKEQVNYLMTLYQSAITYYSALNDDKYKDFKNKIDKLLNMQKIKNYMDNGSEHKEKEKNNNNKEGINEIKKDISNKEEIKNENNVDEIKGLNNKGENKDIIQKEEIKKVELENIQKEKDNIGQIDNLFQNKFEENLNDINKIKEDSSSKKTRR
jgi:ubiquitin-protein ligase